MSPEFELIAKYFTRPVKNATLGVGDDCALVRLGAGLELAITTDTLVAGTHFFADTDPEKLGHKALAVNLSDLAAMGASPRYVTLALTVPSIDEPWLAAFARGFHALAGEFAVELIGGDTTRGPLSITLSAMGEVGRGEALRRDGAQLGDEIWISGSVGCAALALRHMQGKLTLNADAFAVAAERLHQPMPRVTLGCRLVGVATSAIDVSDGLVADLTHICERSHLAADLSWVQVPLSPPLLTAGNEQRISCALAGGDDYELCFTAPASKAEDLQRISSEIGLDLTRIGRMVAGESRVRVRDGNGAEMSVPFGGFDHFTDPA